MAVAAPALGQVANTFLIVNFNLGNAVNGAGYIGAYDLSSGATLGLLNGTDGTPLKIDGLWTLIFGNGTNGGSPDVLYFSAGIQGEAHGLFGSLGACGGPAISDASASPNVLWP